MRLSRRTTIKLGFVSLIVFLLGFSACSANPENPNSSPSSNRTDPFASPSVSPVGKAPQAPSVTKATSPTAEPEKAPWKASPGLPKNVAEIMEAAMELADKGAKTPRPRGDDPSSIKKCADISRPNLRAVEQLQRKANKLSENRYAVYLITTLIHLEACVSCYPNAAMKCYTAKSTLIDSDRTFSKQ